jgi:hypothetical protein
MSFRGLGNKPRLRRLAPESRERGSPLWRRRSNRLPARRRGRPSMSPSRSRPCRLNCGGGRCDPKNRRNDRSMGATAPRTWASEEDVAGRRGPMRASAAGSHTEIPVASAARSSGTRDSSKEAAISRPGARTTPLSPGCSDATTPRPVLCWLGGSSTCRRGFARRPIVRGGSPELRLPLFCRLGLDGEVPDHSTFSKNRHGRFRECDLPMPTSSALRPGLMTLTGRPLPGRADRNAEVEPR